MASKENNVNGAAGSMKGSRKIKLTPDWYRLQQAQVITALGTVHFNFQNLQNLISDAKLLGLRPNVHAISIVINHAYDLAGFGTDAVVSDIQRGCFYNMLWQQPNVDGKWFPGSITLSQARQIGLIVNAAACSLDRLIPAKRRPFHRFDTPDSAGFASGIVPDPDVDKRPDLCAGFRDDENWAPVASVLAAAGQEVSDVFTIPMCSHSGPKSFVHDKLPLSMLTDPQTPWTVSITEQNVGARSIRTNMFHTTKHVVTCEVFLYISFDDLAGDAAVGVQWSSIPDNFNGDKILPAHYTRFFGIMPNYAGTDTDAGAAAIAVPYAPDDWQSFLEDDNLRVFDCQEQKFPLRSFSELSRAVEHFNIGNAANSNPRLNFQDGAPSTLVIPPNSGLAGETAGWYGATAFGRWSSVPVLPFITNHFAVAGMPINVMAKPGCEANIRVVLEGTSALSNVQQTRAQHIYISEYMSDMDKAKSYAVNGTPNGDYAASSWIPAVDNPNSPLAIAVKDIVPHVLKR